MDYCMICQSYGHLSAAHKDKAVAHIDCIGCRALMEKNQELLKAIKVYLDMPYNEFAELNLQRAINKAEVLK